MRRRVPLHEADLTATDTNIAYDAFLIGFRVKSMCRASAKAVIGADARIRGNYELDVMLVTIKLKWDSRFVE